MRLGAVLNLSLWSALASQVSSFLLKVSEKKCRPFSRKTPFPLSSNNGVAIVANPEVEQLKEELLKRIDQLRAAKLVGGDFSIDFGVKGGELNATSRAPQKVDFYSISDSVGYAADAVLSVCDKLVAFSPISNATMFLGDPENGEKAPLNGPWKLLFTTAADATFSTNSTRGDAKVQNVVDAKKGRITNVIDFVPSESSKKSPLLKKLNVVIKATALSEKRVELQFKYAKAVFSRFFFLPIEWNLYIPVPGPLITRIIVFLNRMLRRKRSMKMPPKAYFDVLFLDDDLRIHKTGEDNIFVQARESWTAARRLFQ
ncbi:hypothetical protein ACA910_022010 [Epithemia clementina (nom. ined.)]